MTYRLLPTELVEYAESAKRYYRTQWGIPESKISMEEALDDESPRKLTFHAVAPDHHIICVEVTALVYTDTLDAFVVDCMTRALPVKLYVAIPPEVSADTFKKGVTRAKNNGVGVLEMRSTPKLLHEALPLSLTGVRKPDSTSFPNSMRQSITSAGNNFAGGDPVGACKAIYAELESLTRKIAQKAAKEPSWWKGGTPTITATEPWSSVARKLYNHFKPEKAGCNGLDEAILADILGITRPRNLTNHIPATVAARRKRDQRLRTQFEHAHDLLLELYEQSKPLRVT